MFFTTYLPPFFDFKEQKILIELVQINIWLLLIFFNYLSNLKLPKILSLVLLSPVKITNNCLFLKKAVICV